MGVMRRRRTLGDREESVRDYVLANEEIREEVEIREQVDSDHHPIMIDIKEEKRGVEKKGRGKGG